MITRTCVTRPGGGGAPILAATASVLISSVALGYVTSVLWLAPLLITAEMS